MTRIFSAIPFPTEIKNRVSEIFQGRLPVPYVNTTNLHITLNFFGELTSEELDLAKIIFPNSVAGSHNFAVVFDKISKFRQQIHMTIKPNPDLESLQSRMQKIFEDSGFKFEDRQYYPHVKLANLHMDKIMNPGRRLENFPNFELSKLSFNADRVVLFSSKLLMHHSHHTPLLE